MSYILEALKKSQQERELGQVPRLQAPAFEEPVEETRTQPWVQAAFGLAVVAVVFAGYAALRSPTPQVPTVAAGNADSPVSSAPTLATTPAGAAQRSASPGTAQPPAQGSDTASALALDDPDSLSVEPQVLVVPAAPRPGERLPRGADELRRAVLGPEVSPSVQRRAAAPASAPPVPEYAPVPPELIAEIEDFKRSVEDGTEPSGAQERSGKASAAGNERSRSQKKTKAASDVGRPGPLTSSLRQQLPPFSMTVHVYNDEPSRRFVYLNGKKVREGELTRDGFFVEQVVADGAIFRYEDLRFFQQP